MNASGSPYDWPEHEPGCTCPECRRRVPNSQQPGRPGVPPHIRAQLDQLKARWRAQAAEPGEGPEETSLAQQLAEFDEERAKRHEQEQAG